MKKLYQFLFKLKGNEQGAALILSLLVLLALVLLGLSILLQSNAEYSISLNERDSTIALYNAEAVLELAKLKLRTTSDLSPLLKGPDGAINTADDGVMEIRTISSGINKDQFNQNCSGGSATCEADRSVIENKYEVFRIGMNRDGSAVPGESNWDGPRGLVYVRVTDNHDEEPALDDPFTDTDTRVQVEIISDYPVFVDSTGITTTARSVTNRTIGTSRRTLIARFGPSITRPAIATRGHMELDGGMNVCGDCGTVHANLTMTIGGTDVDICGDVTASEAMPAVDPTAQVGGTVATVSPIQIPISNPFHENFVPFITQFGGDLDGEFTGYPQLTNCPAWDASHPGSTKYFALYGDGAQGRVFKAYWNDTAGVWFWRLIDILGDSNNTILDDCGRVVSFGGAGSPVGDFAPTSPAPSYALYTGPDPDAGTAVPDQNDNAFYGFSFTDSGGPGVHCVASDDDTLSGTANNDYGSVSVISGTTYYLPGTGGPLPATGDGIADFLPADCMKNGANSWRINGGDVYSALYNAVIFVYGNLGINGSPSTLCSTVTPGPCTQALPNAIWRATFLAFNNVDTSGNPAYAPFRSETVALDQQYVIVAGRDLDLSGTAGAGGDICPATCGDPPLVAAGFAGILLAHEQIDFHGTVTVNGLVYSEDAASCSTFVRDPGLSGTGSVEIYYDCVHPPSPVTGQGTVMTSWAEGQQ